MTQNLRVLIADSDFARARALGDRLIYEGFICKFAVARDEALNVARSHECDVAICDVDIGRSHSLELLERIKNAQPRLPVIVKTSAGVVAEAVEAVKHGAFQYLAEPIDIGELAGFIRDAAAESCPCHRSTRPPGSVAGVLSGEIVHESLVMRDLVESIALVARSNSPVLILGETGTGKERVARAIHAGSSRASRPFVALNSSAIPEALLESELFGHVRGAFTGATEPRRGLLTEANGGTLFLDEIGDMPVTLQPKLLRVLQFGEARPVGSDRSGRVDVRVIAATHRNLEVLVDEGSFREDLRYRLNVIPLFVPPLRSRREDILLLVAHFLAEARKRTPESPVTSFSDEALQLLTHAAWPGNVRELENTIERLVVLGRKAQITPTDLAGLHASPTGEIFPAQEGVPWTLKQMQHRYLEWVLAQTHGDKVRTAKILDVDVSTLYRWSHAKRNAA